MCSEAVIVPRLDVTPGNAEMAGKLLERWILLWAVLSGWVVAAGLDSQLIKKMKTHINK